jgi:hypothetical protein
MAENCKRNFIGKFGAKLKNIGTGQGAKEKSGLRRIRFYIDV